MLSLDLWQQYATWQFPSPDGRKPVNCCKFHPFHMELWNFHPFHMECMEIPSGIMESQWNFHPLHHVMYGNSIGAYGIPMEFPSITYGIYGISIHYIM